MNIALWIIQSLVALLFFGAGISKLFRPIEQLATQYPWMKSAPPAFVRFIGVCELAAAVGLILPSLTRILPWMTVAAGVGIAALMACAVVFHLRRREVPPAVITTAILLIALFITVGRWTLAPL